MRTVDTFYQFSDGKIFPLPHPPEWLRDALLAEKTNENWSRSLSDQGAEMIESYGTVNESVDVWRC